MTKIEKLLLSGQNIFTVQDLATLWQISDKVQLWNTIRYYLRSNKLNRIHKGLYAVRNYDSYEVAYKLVIPSYISFYTALGFHGITFQSYETTHSMSLISKKIKIKSRDFNFHRIKEEIFFDPTGIDEVKSDNGFVKYKIADKERAICDSLYLLPNLAFDNLSGVNFDKLLSTAKIYKNKKLEKTVELFYKNYK